MNVSTKLDAPEEKIESPTLPAFTQADYNDVVTAAELLNINLKQVRFDFDDVNFLASQKEKEKRKNLINNSTARTLFDGAVGVGQADFIWSVEVRYKRKRIFFVEAKYGVLYDGLESQNEAAVRSFLRRVGRIASYPYFRSLVAHLSADSGANLPPLPTYKVLKPATTRTSDASP